MASKGTKIALIILGAVVVIAIILVGGLWYIGLFATPELALGERGPYNYVYVDRTGPFTEIPMGYQLVDSLVHQQNIEVGIACGAYLEDPSKVAQENLRWQVGYLVNDSVETKQPLNFKTIANREYLIASIKAIPMIAPFKTYPAMNEWLTSNPYDVIGEAYELYHENGVVEVLFPVNKREE
jgi:effector-binding domain-containing protein